MKYTLPLTLLTVTLLATPTWAAVMNNTSTLIDEQSPATINPATPQFSKVIDDLPLMPGLTLQPDNDVLFVAPHTGRIAESVAVGIVDVDEVYYFYRRSLPQLGWKQLDARSFMRDGEQLTISAKADGKTTRVEFSVTPLR